MNISEFQEVNATRAKRWHSGSKWSLLEWAGAMCGEAGEAANIAKKIRRLEQELPNKEAGITTGEIMQLKRRLAFEVADTIIYGLIIMSEINEDSSEILQMVFNNKSIEYGFPERALNDN